jgi:hypothetical protein
VSLLILVVDDECDVEMLFRQRFRRDLRAPGRYAMDFDQSADTALQRISDAAGASVRRLVGIEVGVVSGVFNLESPGVDAPGWRLRHEEAYHAA